MCYLCVCVCVVCLWCVCVCVCMCLCVVCVRVCVLCVYKFVCCVCTCLCVVCVHVCVLCVYVFVCCVCTRLCVVCVRVCVLCVCAIHFEVLPTHNFTYVSMDMARLSWKVTSIRKGLKAQINNIIMIDLVILNRDRSCPAAKSSRHTATISHSHLNPTHMTNAHTLHTHTMHRQTHTRMYIHTSHACLCAACAAHFDGVVPSSI